MMLLHKVKSRKRGPTEIANDSATKRNTQAGLRAASVPRHLEE